MTGMVFDIYSLFGWTGIALLIIGYVFLSMKKLKKNYVLYHLINLLGGVGLGVSTFMAESWPAFVLSLIIMGMSLAYITKILKTKPDYRDLRE